MPNEETAAGKTFRDHCQYLLVLLMLMAPGCTERREDVTRQQGEDSTQIHDAVDPDDDRISELLELSEPNDSLSVRTHLTFRDIATGAGLEFQRFNDAVPGRYFLPEVMGGGVAWIDIDHDGLFDLYATNGSPLWAADKTGYSNQLFRQRNDRFDAVTMMSGTEDPGYGQGCAVGDCNADGFPDLYITNYGRNTLLINYGDGTFEDGTVDSATGDLSWGTSAVWFDANNDTLADLYVVNYLSVTRSNHQVCTYGGVQGYCGPGHWDGVADVLYMNQGDGGFEATEPGESVENRTAKGLAVAVCDFDRDGQSEIYVGNDMAPNTLLTRTPRTNGDTGRLFRNVADVAGCAVSGEGRNEASMGVACADFDGDGRVDIFLTHYYHHKNTLYRNLDSLLFEDNSRRSRAAATSFETLGFGTTAADFDLDGDEDLFITNGHVLGPMHHPNEMTPQLLENSGHGTFADVSSRMGGYFSDRYVGRGVARGDYDRDGRIDLAVTHVDRPLAVLRNETQLPHHFVGLHLLPDDRILPAGGRVTIRFGSTSRVVPIVCGGSYLSSSDPRITVGLGTHTGPVEIAITWSNQKTDTFSNVPTGRYWMARERSNAPASLVSLEAGDIQSIASQR